jgi:hypothetical protein
MYLKTGIDKCPIASNTVLLMKTIEMTQATSALAKYTQGISEGPIIVTLNGKPVGALITLDNTD